MGYEFLKETNKTDMQHLNFETRHSKKIKIQIYKDILSYMI